MVWRDFWKRSFSSTRTRAERRRRLKFASSSLECLEVRIVPARVNPYLQNPASDAMTVMWFTQENVPGTLTVQLPGGGTQVYTSTPVLASGLAYHPNEVAQLPGGTDPGIPYQHRIRVTGLQAGTTYNYSVVQGSETFANSFKTVPDANSPVRFTVYGDSETEPESTGSAVNWDVPFSSATRQYVVDQTEGYKQNLNVIESRNPDFMSVVGDLVESGGEQRDWEEFWRHNSGNLNNPASHIPLVAAPGNHEDYGGPGGFGGYGDEGSIRGRDKFATYFEFPSNGSVVSTYQDRYFRMDYGPITFISLDVTNGLPHQSSQDTNFFLGPNPGYPDFNPGSTQYQWLEAQLADAATKSQFIFVQYHHAAYSVGPHGFPAGSGTGQDTQSGQPVRALTPLFVEYGVDGVFSGHDEMYEHSVVDGINFYDIGIGGDGLRGPDNGTDGSTGLPSSNPNQVFLAHLDAPEVWNGNQLVSGGKHYGHMEVNVYIDTDGYWKAKLEPVYVFPLMNTSGTITGWERRVYDDVVVLVGNAAEGPIGDTFGVARESQFLLDGNANRAWDSTTGGDLQFQFGSKTDTPLAGDWDGNGYDQIAVHRAGYFYFDYNGNGRWDGAAGGDRVRKFGNPGDIPVVGDWDGDGDDEIGVFRNGEWFLDANGNGTWDNLVGGDLKAKFGIAGDRPVAGDWNGDGKSEVGVFRNGYWYLDLNGNAKYDGPIGGDAISRFGNATDTPIVGDWNKSGQDKLGVFRNGYFYLDVDATRSWNVTNVQGDSVVRYGNSTDIPLIGTWAPTVLSSAPASTTSQAPLAITVQERSVVPQALQFSAADVVFTVSNSTSSPVTLAIYAQSKKNPAEELTLHGDKTVKPGKSKRLRSAITYDPNDERIDFTFKLFQGNSKIFDKGYGIVTDSVSLDPGGQLINPKLQQIDIAILPGNDIRVSVNPRS